MLTKALILRFFDAFTILRWNDHIRPVPLVEMDKNAHKMFIAYCIAKYEEEQGKEVQWHNIIRGGLFELLRRSVLSDIKAPIYRRIRTQHPALFRQLGDYVYEQLEPAFANTKLPVEFKNYLQDDRFLDPLSKDILNAAHTYASYWEFQIIRQASPDGQAVRQIENLILLDLAPYVRLLGLKKLLNREPIAAFIDLVGQLRFQIRWSQTTRLPITSVLGHSMMVASLTYLLTRELPAAPCSERLRNNFFGGLFHDLPECLTRDIGAPLKEAIPRLQSVLAKIERELLQKDILPLIESKWHGEFAYYTQDEFRSKVVSNSKVRQTSSEEISKKFNKDKFCPIDGELIEAADQLAAFVEAYKSIEAGVGTPELQGGKQTLKDTYQKTKKKAIAGVRLTRIYADF